MAANNQTELFLQELRSSGTSLNIKEILYLCLGKWHWFLISIALCLGIAVFHILRTPPVFTRSASLLVKEDSKGNSISGDVSSMFADLGVTASNTNVNNELIALQSPAVMLEVVKRLNLNVEYAVAGLFHDEVIYGSSLPVKVSFGNMADNQSLSFTLQLLTKGKVVLTRLEYGDESVSLPERLEGNLNDTLSTPIGYIVVSPTIHYSKEKEYPTIYVNRADLYSATDACKGRFTATLSSEDATVIDLSYQDVSIQRAEDVLNTLITVYNENWVKDKNQITVSTSQFIADRLGVLERELGDVDEDISSYKSEHLLPDVEAASSLYMTQSQTNSNQILALNTRLSMTRYVRSYLTANAGKNQLIPANSGLDSPGIEQQIADYNSKQLQRNNLVSNSSEQNPLVIDLDQSLAEMRNALIVSIDNHMTALNTQIASLQRSEQRTTAQIAASPNQSKYLQAVGRQQKVKESLYLFLLQKREENELSQAFTAYNTRLITPPTGNFIPVAPKRKNILMIALVIGMIVPFSVILIRENMNSTVRGRKDLEKLSLPFVGEIPLFIGKEDVRKKRLLWKKKMQHTSRSIVVESGKRDIVNEAFRVLRTNLEFILDTKEDKDKASVTLVTSFNPGSGKTFLTMNTAATFAMKGKRVLVIDGDLRRGSASAYIDSPSKGLSDYLGKRVNEISSLIVEKENYPGLFVLPAGTIPPNPTELLAEPRLAKLIEQMRLQYDYIFIDCPPVDIVADTQIIEKLADRTVFIVRAGLLERDMLPELQRNYDEKRFKNMALVLNGTEGGGHRYSYRYGYKYGYKYGYSYGYGGKSYYGNSK